MPWNERYELDSCSKKLSRNFQGKLNLSWEAPGISDFNKVYQHTNTNMLTKSSLLILLRLLKLLIDV